MSKDKPKENRNMIIITYLIGFLFVGLIGYFGFFIEMKSEDVINNPYNARLDLFSERIVRGKVLSSDKTVLAETLQQPDGGEIRVYPHGARFAHVVGYSGSNQGKAGLEALGNYYLLSSHMNFFEQKANEFSSEKSIGDQMVTTLDFQLQNALYDALGDRRGAIVAMEPGTGKVLAMVSKPDFDPNTVMENWEQLVAPENDQAQLLNRCTQGLYSPGSTFKIITALEYIREFPDSYKNYLFQCSGKYHYNNNTIRCFHETAHGNQDLFQAFANSCNGAFASMGPEFDLNRFSNTTEELLFNQDLPIEIPYRKSSYTMAAGAPAWEMLQTSMGQGETQISPMHNAMLVSAIANGGTLMSPYFIDYIENAGGEQVKKFMPAAYGSLMSAEEAAILTEMMEGVVKSGTASALASAEYAATGKTGSAEFEAGKETHSWFVGFAPAQNPKIVLSIVVEESGTGGSVAAPLARGIFDSYLLR